VLVQFAKKAYTNYKTRETDAQYEIRLALPAGWKLLTTASNTGTNNGYFGAAYWHPEHQQVVIAHRGTIPKRWGALWTDLQGVLRNKYVRQMQSASTFSYKIVEVLREVNDKNGTCFQVFFSGHSLGGWLAQVTTFTAKYLRVEGNTFLKINDDQKCYHPHTVVFDSPGCKEMLSQMAGDFDVRLYGRSTDLEHLDITSYLSAPNLVNTCNAHVGTVYRIFVDLTDMGWWTKHTALYTLVATHSKDKIEEAFNPKAMHVVKDEKGKLRIQVVIDWPISGFKYNEEYRSFFKWAKHFNNYHPDTTGVIFQLKGYQPIRYQTTNYDEGVTSISIFSQEERQFLENYRWLRRLPQFFKPKGLFSEIGNDQAEKEAVEILQCFEIQKGKIQCSTDTELQKLIPYVKRLLQLFPQLQENTNGDSTPQQITSNFCQFVTKSYVENIHESPLEFESDALSLRDFLDSDEQKVLHLGMVDGDAWTGLIKVYQVLQKTPSMTDFRSEGHYTILTLEHLLLVNQMVNLNALMESTATPHLLMMSCKTNELSKDETKQTVVTLFNTLKQNRYIKFIITTQRVDNSVTSLLDTGRDTFGNGFVTRDEQLTWSHLTTSSQKKLLEKTIRFQGTSTTLNVLVPADSPLVNSLPLAALLEERQLEIGEPVPISDDYNEACYIGRTFRY
jgi:hypothetical protein